MISSMDENIYSLTIKLKESLKNHPSIILLNEIEKEMENNEEVMKLSFLKDQANDKYNDMVKYFSENSNEASSALKELHQAKLNLDNHPLVKKYLKSYQEVRELYQEINALLFDITKEDNCPKERD